MKKITLIFILLVGSFSLSAQPDDPDPPTPFGFLEILLGAGAIYGGKKVYDNKKQEEAND